jgi:hypothetical protein
MRHSQTVVPADRKTFFWAHKGREWTDFHDLLGWPQEGLTIVDHFYPCQVLLDNTFTVGPLSKLLEALFAYLQIPTVHISQELTGFDDSQLVVMLFTPNVAMLCGLVLTHIVGNVFSIPAPYKQTSMYE